jgi:hypothetical protein
MEKKYKKKINFLIKLHLNSSIFISSKTSIIVGFFFISFFVTLNHDQNLWFLIKQPGTISN